MKEEAKQINRLNLTPEQAIGVALSCSPVWQGSNMDACQTAAPKVLKHLNNMGFHLMHEEVLKKLQANSVGTGLSCLSNSDLYAEVK
jgi:hypothetical protein